jgi:hypothetical protein
MPGKHLWDHAPAIDYEVEPRSIYGHARSFGFFDQRDRNIRFSLGHIIQRAQNLPATGDTVVRAVRAFTCINRAGEWVEPPTHVIVTPGSHAPVPANVPPPADVIEVVSPSNDDPAKAVVLSDRPAGAEGPL